VYESIIHLPQLNWFAAVIFLVCTVALLVLGKKWPKVPWAILIAIIGIVLGNLGSHGLIPFALETLQTKYGNLDAGYMFFFPTGFTTSMLSANMIKGGMAISFIAMLETLISAKIADGMTKTKHNQRKEVFGLSIANIMSGKAD
jgi:sulfate permease, SulP family